MSVGPIREVLKVLECRRPSADAAKIGIEDYVEFAVTGTKGMSGELAPR